MESILLPCKSISPKLHDFSQKPQTPKLPFNTTLKVSDAHLIHLSKNNRLHEAVTLLSSAEQCGSKVSPTTFAHLIQSCIDSRALHLARKLHNQINQHLGSSRPFLESKLLSMYAKCGSLEDAYKVFDEMQVRDLYTWSSMIGAFSRERKWGDVVELFYLMMEEGVVADEFLVPRILQACGNRRDVETGRLIHSIAVRAGMIGEIRVSNSILAVYSKCGWLETAQRFFDSMERRDRVSWNSIITGFCQKGEIEEGRRLFELMREQGVQPGLVTWNILISSYNLLGKCNVAMDMMKEMRRYGITPDVFTWTSMISGFVQDNRADQALELFREMVLEGIELNEVALMSGISACSMLKDLRKARELHSVAVKIGFGEDVLVGNTLLDMYSKCGKLDVAQKVFDIIPEKDIYTWNSMIAGYCHTGYCGKAHDMFMKMQESGESPNVVTWNVMITGYIQNGDEDRAMDLFERMERDGKVKRDQASWNALIAGYLQHGHKDKAFWIFRQMLNFCVNPNPITILSILPACANLIAAKKVKEIHCCVLRRGLESNLSVGNSLIDTYAKSGNIIYSLAIFEMMSSKDIITWNSLMSGYVLHGCSDFAIELFNHMNKVGPKPNRGTFVSLILACGLAHKVQVGKDMFQTMVEEYNIVPCVDHYEAMIALYGRSGMLKEAFEFIENMATEPESRTWAAFLTACRIHGDIKLAIHAGEKLLKLDPGSPVIQLLVSQLCALYGIDGGFLKLKNPGQRNGPCRSPGRSWTECSNIVYTFVAGQKHCNQGEVVYSLIKRLAEKTRTLNCSDWLCIEEEEKEETTGIHSEKLALAFHLISPQKSQSIRIVKSLRICGDCHTTLKYVSKAYGCEVYLKDPKCLHHFKEGHCSCGDYW